MVVVVVVVVVVAVVVVVVVVYSGSGSGSSSSSSSSRRASTSDSSVTDSNSDIIDDYPSTPDSTPFPLTEPFNESRFSLKHSTPRGCPERRKLQRSHHAKHR